MARRLKRWFTIALVVVAALVVAALATIFSIDFNAHRDRIAAEIERATGRKVSIAGDLSLALGLTPRLAVAGVSVANRPGGSRQEMLRIARLEAEVALLPLLGGEVEVRRLLLIGADLLLEVNAAGEPNWVFGAPASPTSEGPTLPMLRDMLIENSKLAYAAGERRYEFRIDRLTSKEAEGNRLAIELAGAVNDAPLRLAGTVGTLAALRGPRAWPLALKLMLGGVEVSVDGAIARPLEATGAELKVSATAANLTFVPGLAGTALAIPGPFIASFGYSDADGAHRLKQIQSTLGASDVAGDLAITLSGPRPRLAGSLKSDRLALEELLPAKAASGDGRLFANDALPFELLRLADGDVTYKVARLTTGGLALDDADMTLSLNDGRLQLQPVRGRLSDGELTATAAIDTAVSPPVVRLELRLAKADLQKTLRAAADSELLRGTLDLNLRGAGAGGSVREIMARLDGRADMVVADGYIANKYVELLAADLLTSLAPWSKDQAGTKVNCFAADFPIARGLATARVLLLDTVRMTVTGKGTVDLGAERLNLLLDPKPKEPSLLSLATPVNVTGPLTAPVATPDPAGLAEGAAGAVAGNILLPGAGLLLPLVSAGSDDQHPCLKLVRQAAPEREAKPASASAPAKSQSSGGGIGGFLNRLGDKIDRTLGVK